jgi:uncharacterized protein (UPF0548 family)
MLSFRKPSPEILRQIIAQQAPLEFTYPGVGETKEGGAAPRGFMVDRTRVLLGRGSVTFERAKAALQRWRQFQLGWIEAFPSDTPLRAGETVVVVANLLGTWWTNAARIVYTIDEAATTSPTGVITVAFARFGFAYGTLPAHVERGEERFLVEWDRRTDEVAYDILAFSRPRHILTRLGYPFARRMQHQFAKQSAAAMQRIAGYGG